MTNCVLLCIIYTGLVTKKGGELVTANKAKDENSKRVQVVLPITVIDKLDKLAKAKGFNGVSAMLRFIAVEYLEKS